MTTGYSEWRRLIKAVENEYDYDEEDAEEIIGFILRAWERDAVDRAIKTVVVAHPEIVALYQTNVKFHHALNVIAQVMVAGVFGRNDLTDEEAKLRIQNLQTLVNSLS